MKIKIRNVIFMGSAIILLLLLSVVFVYQYYSICDRIENDQVKIAEQYIQGVNDRIEDTFFEMNSISEKVVFSLLTSSLIDWDAKDFSVTNANLKKKTGELLYYICDLNNLPKYSVKLYNSDGKCIYLGHEYGNRQLNGPPSEELFWANEAMRRGGSFFVTEPYADENTENIRKVSLTRAISNLYKVDKTVVFIDVQIRESKLTECVWENVPDLLGKEFGMMINDENGRVLFNNGYFEDVQSLRLEGVSETTQPVIHEFEGKSYVVLSIPMEKYGWQTSVMIPVHNWYQAKRNIIQSLVFMALSILVLVLAALYIETRIATRSLTDLSDEMSGVDINNLGEKPYYLKIESNIDEVNRLVRGINVLFKRTYDSICDAYEARIRKTQAELKSLQLLVSPHFLFNSMAVIKILAKRDGSEATVKAIECLSDMMYYLCDLQQENVAIRDEIRHVENYLHLMRLRRNGNISVNIDIPEKMMDTIVPKLCIQPIIENCFKNNNSAEGIRIEIKGACSSSLWMIEVKDNGTGFSDEAIERIGIIMRDYDKEAKTPDQRIGGYSLVNIYFRIKLLYGNDAMIDYGNNKDGGAYIRIGGRQNV